MTGTPAFWVWALRGSSGHHRRFIDKATGRAGRIALKRVVGGGEKHGGCGKVAFNWDGRCDGDGDPSGARSLMPDVILIALSVHLSLGGFRNPAGLERRIQSSREILRENFQRKSA
jgi:hypothetical protein